MLSDIYCRVNNCDCSLQPQMFFSDDQWPKKLFFPYFAAFLFNVSLVFFCHTKILPHNCVTSNGSVTLSTLLLLLSNAGK